MEQSQIHRIIIKAIQILDDMLYEYEEQRYFYINNRVHGLINQLKKFESDILPEVPELAPEYVEKLKSLLMIYERRDYIEFMDFIQQELKPFLCNSITALYEKNIYNELPDKQYIDSLYSGKLSREKEQLLKQTSNIQIPDTYILKETMIGLYTLSIQKQKTVYIHSKYEPYLEAIRIAECAYNNAKNVEEYGMKNIIIFGLGLGYHIDKLAEYKDVGKITVIEPDINILAITLQYIGLSSFSNDKVQVIYDPQLSTFRKIMDTQQNLYIYYPAVENMENIKLQNAVKNLFQGITARNSHLPSLVRNFNQNITLNDTPLYNIRNEFFKKNIVIVAGGPSLEECISALKKLKSVKEQLVIIAVGTVFKKLKKENITPDYVIITDAQPGVSNQIKDVDINREKLLYLSTVDFNVPVLWKGKRYIIFQKDFDYVEKFVKAMPDKMQEEDYYQLVLTGGSVSTTAFDIGLRYGANCIITIGLDLAFYNNQFYANGIKGKSSIDQQYYDMYVTGNEGGKIPTCRNMNNYRLWLENRIRIRNTEEKKTRLINCSKGAVIAGMEYIPLNQLLSDKSFLR